MDVHTVLVCGTPSLCAPRQTSEGRTKHWLRLGGLKSSLFFESHPPTTTLSSDRSRLPTASFAADDVNIEQVITFRCRAHRSSYYLAVAHPRQRSRFVSTTSTRQAILLPRQAGRTSPANPRLSLIPLILTDRAPLLRHVISRRQPAVRPSATGAVPSAWSRSECLSAEERQLQRGG